MKMKSKLMAASVMLVLSIVMMSTASYAWFTISTAPEIKGMTTQVVVNENLEIALATGKTDATSTSKVPGATALNDTGKYTTWGNLVNLGDTGDATTYAKYNTLDKTLRPAALNKILQDGNPTDPVTGKTFGYPTYGVDGRPNENLSALNETTTVGMGNLTGGIKLSDSNTYAYGYYVDYWIRTNENGTISLSVADERSSSGETGLGSYLDVTETSGIAADALAANLQVGFRLLGSSAATPKEGSVSGEYEYSDVEVKSEILSTTTTNNVTQFAKVPVQSDNTKYTLSGDLFEATANTAYLVRIYVWLEGENVTNAAASVDAANLIDATINLQFKNTAVTTSMDAVPTT